MKILLYVLLAVLVANAIWQTVKRVKHGSECCGRRDEPEKKIKISDRNRANYPYRYLLNVEGMVCSNCATRVENALNSNEGIWASVDLGKKEVTVLSKSERTEHFFRKAVNSTAYVMTGFSEI